MGVLHFPLGPTIQFFIGVFATCDGVGEELARLSHRDWLHSMTLSMS
jgi:hypothetical protein